jgi:hypothetical protein
MLTSRSLHLALSVVCLSLALAFGTDVSGALAAGPATVTVRVEGLTETKVPPTLLTTNTTPVVNDGKAEDACSGTSGLGALQLATNGNWSGPWEYGQYFIDTIAGETHVYEKGMRSFYWSFWVNDKYSELGACEVQLESGDRVLFFPECDEACPAGPSPTPLEIEAPATAGVGEPVNVTVSQYNAKGEPAAAVGASIADNAGGATTDSQGHATLTFGAAGSYQIHASGSESGPPAVRAETTICVHNGDDGTCGTTAPSGTPSPSGSSSPSTLASGVLSQRSQAAPLAFAADLLGIGEGRRYSERDAPRVLSGKVITPSPVTSISLRLRRTYHGRCWAYSGARERLQRVRCRAGGFFRIASGGETFSYLLPSRLPPGRYVLDVEATDASGSRTTLARNTSRLVFYVG